MQVLNSYLAHVVYPFLNKPKSIASLAYFRIVFGLLVLSSTTRFILLGWVEDQYLSTSYHFTYLGFDWVQPYSPFFLYAIFGLLFLSSIAVAFGWYYRYFSVLLFFSFTYIELLDKSYYLNHYYFVSIVAFILIFLPAHKNYSFDATQQRTNSIDTIPNWILLVLQIQIAIVYIAAGIAKINPDWLFNALPLKIWLPAKDAIPIIGGLFAFKWTPYLFSWAGMLFDCTVPFFLWWKRTRILAYLAVVIFHLFTGILFQIGVFPIVMILLTPIFFEEKFHQKLLKKLNRKQISSAFHQPSRFIQNLFVVHLVIQILLPFRPLLYNGNMFWTEEGYRFGWRVMLAEKAGTATFYVTDEADSLSMEKTINNSDFINLHQEKQMAFQPDMILQFAHYLEKVLINKYGFINPSIRCESYVTLNGSASSLLIDPTVDLTKQKRGFAKKQWILSQNQ